jgi:hypothetical protein
VQNGSAPSKNDRPLVNDDKFVSNHDKILPSDDGNIAQYHYFLSRNDSKEVQNVAKQGQRHSAREKNGSFQLNDDKNIV